MGFSLIVQLFRLLQMDINRFHLCDGDWKITDKPSALNLKRIEPYLNQKQLICFDDIAWKGKGMNVKLDPKRYNDCDIDYPCIVSEGMNPLGCKYRMIDGKHRITKMEHMGMSEAYFYTVDFNEIRRLSYYSPDLVNIIINTSK